MGWIDYLKDTVKGLRTAGKSEKDIESMVEQAADKATVTKGTNAKDAVDAMVYAVEAHRIAQHRQSNNWRKMHHLPMRRKGGERNGRAGSSHRHR